MSLKKLFAIVFVALVLFFLFGTLAMAWDWPTNPILEHPWDDVTRLAPGHNPWQPQLYEHTWDDVNRINPVKEHPDQELWRIDPMRERPDQELFRPPSKCEDHPWDEVKRIDPVREHPQQEGCVRPDPNHDKKKGYPWAEDSR